MSLSLVSSFSTSRKIILPLQTSQNSSRLVSRQCTSDSAQLWWTTRMR
jgi:hypothetical protein